MNACTCGAWPGVPHREGCPAVVPELADERPGRQWSRVVWVVAIALLAVAVAFAFPTTEYGDDDERGYDDEYADELADNPIIDYGDGDEYESDDNGDE